MGNNVARSGPRSFAWGAMRWYHVTPTLDQFFAGAPLLKDAGTSPQGSDRFFRNELRRSLRAA